MPWKVGDEGCNFDLMFQYHFSSNKDGRDDDAPILSVTPREIICFAVQQPGSEPGVIGLAIHQETAVDSSTGKRVPAHLVGWNWRHFCKTQYASLSHEGGFDNFFTIHDGLCRIFDEAKRIGLDVKVNDEGGYHENRDKEKLRHEVNRWNTTIAAVAGSIQDARGPNSVQSPITAAPEIELLEAEGQPFLEKKPQIQIIKNLDKDDSHP